MKRKKEYLLFAATGDYEYREGGALDFIMRGTLAECKAEYESRKDEWDWAQVVDSASMGITLRTCPGYCQRAEGSWGALKTPNYWDSEHRKIIALFHKRSRQRDILGKMVGRMTWDGVSPDEFNKWIEAAIAEDSVDPEDGAKAMRDYADICAIREQQLENAG